MTRTERAIFRAAGCGGAALLITNGIGQPWPTAFLAAGVGALLCLLLLGGRP